MMRTGHEARSALLAVAAALAVAAGAVCADLARSGSSTSPARDGRARRRRRHDRRADRRRRRRERVRILGVDTPERGACGAPERATAETLRLTDRRTVRLAGDRSQARRDRYGRLLAYVSAPGAPDVGRGCSTAVSPRSSSSAGRSSA